MSALPNLALEAPASAGAVSDPDSSVRADPAAPPRELYHSEADAARYELQSFLCLFGIHVSLYLALAGWMPVWAMAAAVMVLMPRLHLPLHELLHMRPVEQVNWFTRLNTHIESPISLGYREYRIIHLEHHRFTATEQDPEWYQIRGGHLRALVYSMFTTEQSFVRWVLQRGMSRSLLVETLIRLVPFAVALWWNPQVFLVYLVALRTTAWLSQFTFHHVLHYRNGQYGTFRLVLPKPLMFVAGVFVGWKNLPIVCEHPTHHEWPMVRATALSDIRR